MTTFYKREVRRGPFRLRVFVRQIVRVCLMLLVLGLIPVLLSFLVRRDPVHFLTGMVEADSETIGSVETARILSIEVQPGQPVKAGDVLVRLDPADRDLNLAVEESRLLDCQQNLVQIEQGVAHYRQTLQESERRCRQIVQEASVALETEKMNRTRDEAELAALKAEMARLQPLVEKRLVSEIELSSLRPKAQALEETVSRYEPLIAALKRRCEQADRDLGEVRTLLVSAEQTQPGNVITASLQRVTQNFCQASRKEPFVLRASRAGVVSRVQRQAGDVVRAGEPIVRVASSSSPYITGMLMQNQFAGLKVGDKLRVVRAGTDSVPVLTAQVEAIDPEVMDLLDPFNPVPRFPTRGRHVRLRVLEPDNALVPGETVTMRLKEKESWWNGLRGTCLFPGCRPAPL